MAKDIIKKRMGRPKGSKDKKGKNLKNFNEIPSRPLKSGFRLNPGRLPKVPLTEESLEQKIKELQEELQRLNMKANVAVDGVSIPVGWTKKTEGDIDIYESPIRELPKDFKDLKITWTGEPNPPKPRGRPKRHVEALQKVIGDSPVSQVEKPREDQTVSSETIINKPSNIMLGHSDHLFKGDEPRSPGRPKGSKNKITLVLEKIGDDNAAEVYQKMVDLALGRSSEGDAYACKFILDRVYPQRKGRRFNVETRGPVDTPSDINEFSKKVMTLLAEGEISAEEAVDYGRVFEQGMKTMTDTEVVKKIESTCQKVEDIKNGR